MFKFITRKPPNQTPPSQPLELKTAGYSTNISEFILKRFTQNNSAEPMQIQGGRQGNEHFSEILNIERSILWIKGKKQEALDAIKSNPDPDTKELLNKLIPQFDESIAKLEADIKLYSNIKKSDSE